MNKILHNKLLLFKREVKEDRDYLAEYRQILLKQAILSLKRKDIGASKRLNNKTKGRG